MVKKKLTLSIDEGIINQAKGQGINLSAFVEMQLVDYLTRKSSVPVRIRTRVAGSKGRYMNRVTFLPKKYCIRICSGVVWEGSVTAGLVT